MPYKISIKFHPIPSTLNFSRFFVATMNILKFLSLKIMCTHVRQNFWKVSSNSEHHSKPTMNINSQHHNLLGNQIFAQIGRFLYLAAILYLGYHGNGRHFEFVQTPKSCHILRWTFLQSGS